MVSLVHSRRGKDQTMPYKSINMLYYNVRLTYIIGFKVGGYAVEYENLTFVTVRGAGHFVPSYQPERATVLFSSFLQGNLPPSDY